MAEAGRTRSEGKVVKPEKTFSANPASTISKWKPKSLRRVQKHFSIGKTKVGFLTGGFRTERKPRELDPDTRLDLLASLVHATPTPHGSRVFTPHCKLPERRFVLLSFSRLGHIINYSARLCRWHAGGNSTTEVFYNQALNTLFNYVARGWAMMEIQLNPQHFSYPQRKSVASERLNDARLAEQECDLWITDPPYADAVNYEELSEFFLAWYKPHLQACFPDWYTDSKRDHAVKGDDAPFRVAMAECYTRLAEKMPDDGLQVLMFTHKDTDVWEDLALIMWAAGLQVKQVWSIATETRSGQSRKATTCRPPTTWFCASGPKLRRWVSPKWSSRKSTAG